MPMFVFYTVLLSALDGQLKHEDTNLASSTLVHDPSQKENLGIIVQYKVRKHVFYEEIFAKCD